MEILSAWLSENYIELIGFVAAVLYLWFSVRQHIFLWPFGIITSLVYTFLFYQEKIYGYAGLNAYYVVISIYGWLQWNRLSKQARDEGKESDVPTHSSSNLIIMLIGLTLWIIMYWLLKHYTDSPIPVGDSFTTAFSIVATWMLAKKYIEHWLFWIVIDLTAFGLYVFQDLYLTSMLYLIYTIMAIVGYREWKKSMQLTD